MIVLIDNSRAGSSPMNCPIGNLGKCMREASTGNDGIDDINIERRKDSRKTYFGYGNHDHNHDHNHESLFHYLSKFHHPNPD